MARHAKDLDACLEISSLWKHLTVNDDTFIFNVGDTVYTIRGIDRLDGVRYIIDSQSSVEHKHNGTRVRYLIDSDLDVYEVKYILHTDLDRTRCVVCGGVDIVYDVASRGDICQDCENLVF